MKMEEAVWSVSLGLTSENKGQIFLFPVLKLLVNF